MKLWIQATSCLALCFCCGCMDGPFYALKKVNPYFIAEWHKDREHGTTFEEKYSELKVLENKIGSMTSAEQADWIPKLEEIVRTHDSAEMRRQAVLCLANVPGSSIEAALNIASTDDVEKVRLAACQAWKARGGEPGKNMLLSMARSDSSNSVRQSAIVSLSEFNDPEVIRSLGSMLDDSSPAILHTAAKSLEDITGQEFGGNVDGWKQFIASSAPPPAANPDPSSAPGLNANVEFASGTNGLPQIPLPQ